MKLARLTLLSLLLFLLSGLASQAGHGPVVGVVIDGQGLSSYEVDRLAYLFRARAHRNHYEIEFRFTQRRDRRHYRSRRSHRFGRFNRFNDRGYYSRDWDFTVRLDIREGYYDRCGRYREHYDWYVVDHYDRVIKRGHSHHYDRIARDVAQVVYRHWR